MRRLNRSSRRRRLGPTLLTGGALALLMAFAAAAPVGAAGVPAADGSAARVPTISRGGLTVAIPRPGMGVVASELLADGTERELQVETAPDGRAVVVSAPGAPAQTTPSDSAPGGGVTPAGSPPACSDRTHVVNPSWWHQTFHWSFKAASKPANMTAATAENQLKKAVANITGEHNDCHRADHVSATSHYDGRTTRGTEIGSDASCDATDGHNTVAFGNLPSGAVGFTCWWYTGHTTVEADMLLNKHDFRFAVKPSNCSGAYILQDVTTHEFGHVYGLGHATPQDQHANLTMSPAVYFCDDSDETLGLGDMLGLETHY